MWSWSAARSRTLADRALGFAAAADAELAEPAAGLRLQRRRSRRLPHDSGSHRVLRRLRQGDSGAVRTHTTVTSVRRSEAGYLVRTDRATGSAGAGPRVRRLQHRARRPSRPGPRSIATLTAQQYRNPEQLADGGVLVVGASASGIQIADEIHRSGRPVTLAVGEHIRAPRLYRGRDLQWWMDAAGMLDERYDELDDIGRAAGCRRCSSPARPTADARSQCPHRHRREARRPPRRHHGTARRSSPARSQHVHAVRPEDGPAARPIDAWARDNGIDGTSRRRTAAATRVDPRRRSASTSQARSGRSSGPPAFVPTILAQRAGASIARARSATTAVSSRFTGPLSHGPAVPAAAKSALIDGAGDDAHELSAHLAAYLAGEPHHAGAGAAG